MWPFRSRPEQRQQSDYTQSVIDRIVAAWSAGDTANVGATAAAAIAAGAIGRSFAAATVSPSVERTGLAPDVLAQIGAGFVLAGESVWLIEVGTGGVALHRASSWDITGDGPTRWRYRLTIPGPSGMLEYNRPAEGVLHPRANMSASEPHRGRSTVGLAGMSATALANAEKQLADELSGPVGRLIPAPLDQLGSDEESDPVRELTDLIGSLAGRSALVPSMSREWGGASAPAAADWKSTRLGADPPDSVVKLREQGHNAMLAAAGVPPMMFSVGGQAQASREALRQFLHMTVAPLARVLETEASRKLAGAVRLDFTALHASDVQGRARAFQSMVGAGMSIPEAAAVSGILIEEE